MLLCRVCTLVQLTFTLSRADIDCVAQRMHCKDSRGQVRLIPDLAEAGHIQLTLMQSKVVHHTLPGSVALSICILFRQMHMSDNIQVLHVMLIMKLTCIIAYHI